MCPRPQHLGTILEHYRPDDMIHPGGSGFVLTYDGPSWGHVVETLRHRFELQGLESLVSDANKGDDKTNADHSQSNI